MTDQVTASPPSHVFPAAPIFSKTPRERIILLKIEAEHCPYVLHRALLALADFNLIPFTIAAHRHHALQFVEIEIDSLAIPNRPILLQKLRRMPMVRRANIADARERAGGVSPISAKV